MASYMNEAGWDRVLRVLLGVVLLYLGWAGVATGTLGIVFKIAGFLPLLTGLIGWCPAYALFGVSTCGAARGGGPTMPKPAA
jgi:hypothetical protein